MIPVAIASDSTTIVTASDKRYSIGVTGLRYGDSAHKAIVILYIPVDERQFADVQQPLRETEAVD
jgi:hypothetical protein